MLVSYSFPASFPTLCTCAHHLYMFAHVRFLAAFLLLLVNNQNQLKSPYVSYIPRAIPCFGSTCDRREPRTANSWQEIAQEMPPYSQNSHLNTNRS